VSGLYPTLRAFIDARETLADLSHQVLSLAPDLGIPIGLHPGYETIAQELREIERRLFQLSERLEELEQGSDK
jgi:hypothetical protein